MISSKSDWLSKCSFNSLAVVSIYSKFSSSGCQKQCSAIIKSTSFGRTVEVFAAPASASRSRVDALVAFDVAARYPDRITTLFMVGTSIPMPVGEVLLNSAKDDLHVAKEMVNFWSHSKSAHIGGSQVPGTWMIGKLQRLLERSGPGVIYNDLKACQDYTSGIERSSDISSPTLLILGEDDFMTPVTNSKSLAENIPQSRTVMLPNCGHAIVNEAPNEMLDAIATIV